jgi:predicted O-methyltransferase YrrM
MNVFQLKRFLGFLQYNLKRPHHNGHGIHSPFLFDFVTNVLYSIDDKKKIVIDIENIRKQLKKSTNIVKVEDLGAGSVKLAPANRKIKDIVRISSITPKLGLLLYKIVHYSKPNIIIELGTCLGLGTMYLASGNATSKVFTIEGSDTLMQMAKKNFNGLNITNIFTQHGNFDDVLPVILKENSKFDLMYIDGNHRKEAVLKYFYNSLPFAHDNSIIIIDDIRWSEEMYATWLELCCNKNVKLSLDLFKIGIIFFNSKLRKQHVKLYY